MYIIIKGNYFLYLKFKLGSVNVRIKRTDKDGNISHPVVVSLYDG